MDKESSDIFLAEILVLICLTVLVAGGLALLRFIKATTDNNSTKAAINSIRKDPSVARQFSYSLDVPYSTINNFSAAQFDKLKAFMKGRKFIGQYRILYSSFFDINHLIVFTELTYSDFIMINPEADHEREIFKKAIHNFLLTFDQTRNTLVVRSNVYSETQEKFQKQEFIGEFFKEMQKPWVPKV